QEVVTLLDAHYLPRDHFQVEVTERVLMEASNSAMTALRRLRDSGVKVGLDDFGTGYSSLAYLRQFPLDFVKIDRSFVQGLTVRVGEDAIVAAIIGLAHAIGLYVEAEGVETAGQLDALNLLGCDRAQGFLLARPAAPGRSRCAHHDRATSRAPVTAALWASSARGVTPPTSPDHI